MFIQVVRGSFRVLPLDPSGFSITGKLSLANRTIAFFKYFLSILMFNILFCRTDCAISSYCNFYLFEIIVRNFRPFEATICFPMSNIMHRILTNNNCVFYLFINIAVQNTTTHHRLCNT